MYKRSLVFVAALLSVGVVAAPSSASVLPSRDLLPDGDTRPIIVSAQLVAPQPHNAILEADLVIDAYDNDGVARYEYRWSGATIGGAHGAVIVAPTVSYASVTPDTPYALDVRAIDVNNNASDWHSVWKGVTPGVPNVVVAGDSIASGYTREWFTGPASCTDDDYSYGSALVAEIAAGLPPQWSPTYTNIAWAGAGVEDMVSGASDSCGVAHRSQVDEIQEIASDDTWNVVAITAGINSTNWTDVVIDLTKDATLSLSSSGDKDVCDSAVNRTWNIERRRSFVTDTTASVSAAITQNTNAQVLWTGYYDITNTELAPLWRPITGACSDEMAYALDTLHGALRSGLNDEVTWVDVDESISTQQWAGWPHPNREGQRSIGHRVALALNS